MSFREDANFGQVNVGGKDGAQGTTIKRIKVFSPTITPAATAGAVSAEQTFTVTGLRTTDKVIVNPFAPSNSVNVGGVRVSAANTLAVNFTNPTAGALTYPAGAWQVIAVES
jgi:hypothetical protein